nr:uncharacterized protein LOC113728635 [Coffea arabica]
MSLRCVSFPPWSINLADCYALSMFVSFDIITRSLCSPPFSKNPNHRRSSSTATVESGAALLSQSMLTFLMKNKLFSLLLFFFLLFAPSPTFSLSFPLSNYGTLLSLSHSLAMRVANLRASRGDFTGSARARTIAHKIESVQGRGLCKFTWNLGSDYLKNYAWRDINTVSLTDLSFAVSDLNELLRELNELSRVGSDSERVAWVGRNYNRVFTVSRSLFDKLLKIFRQSGPFREVVETMQKEVVEGDLLRDCLELGTNDLKGLIQVLKDMAAQYTASTFSRTDL